MLLANVEGWRALSRAAHALAQAEKGKAPVSGPANPPSGGQSPRSPNPVLSDSIKPVESQEPNQQSQMEQISGEATSSGPIPESGPIKVEAKNVSEQDSGRDAINPQSAIRDPQFPRSDQVKAEAETLHVDATPGNAGRDGGRDSRWSEGGRVLAGRGGGGDSRGLADGRAEKVYGGDNSTRDPGSSPPISGQIKANVETLRVDASPGNAGILAGRGGGGDSRGLADGRAEKVYGESGSVTSALPTDARPPSDPRDSLPQSRPALPGSDPIKPEAKTAPERRTWRSHPLPPPKRKDRRAAGRDPGGAQ